MSAYNPDCELCDGSGVSTGYACQMPAHPCPRCTMPRPDPSAASVHAAWQQDTVPLPTNADQAAAMVRLGTMWLEQNAPDRLKSPQPQQGETNGTIDGGNALCNHVYVKMDEKPSTHLWTIGNRCYLAATSPAVDAESLRNAALEEAAKVCEWKADGEDSYCCAPLAKSIAADIRALKATKGASNG